MKENEEQKHNPAVRGDLLRHENKGFDQSDSLRRVAQIVVNTQARFTCIEEAASYLFKRGVAIGRFGRLLDAIYDLTASLSLVPCNVQALYNRAVAYQMLEEYKLAFDDCTRAIELDPNFAPAYSVRGVCFAEFNLHDQSSIDFERAIELNPDWALPYFNKGVLNYNLGNYREALKQVNYALQIEWRPEFLQKRGKVHFRLRNFLDAIDDFTSVLELAPDFVNGYILRACSLMELQEWRKAAEDLTTAIAFSPHDALAYFKRACAYVHTGEYTLARSDFRAARDLDNSFEPTLVDFERWHGLEFERNATTAAPLFVPNA